MNKLGAAITTRALVSIVVAVVGILMIVLLVNNLYDSTTGNTENENAEKVLESLIGKIELLNSGEEGIFSFRSPCDSPEGCEWALVSFSNGEEPRPGSCGPLESCICNCKIGDTRFLWEDVADSQITRLSSQDIADACFNQGVCENIEIDRIEISSFRDIITRPTGSSGPGTEFSETSVSYVPLQRALTETKISRSDSDVSISFQGSDINREELILEGSGP